MLYYNKHSAYLFKRKCLNWLTVEVLYGIWLLLVQASLTWHFKPKRWREFHHVHCKLKKTIRGRESTKHTVLNKTVFRVVWYSHTCVQFNFFFYQTNVQLTVFMYWTLHNSDWSQLMLCHKSTFWLKPK